MQLNFNNRGVPIVKRAPYVLAGFVSGVIVASGAAWAGTSYVSSLKESATVHVNGGFATTGTALVYGGTTYSEIYAIQHSLQQAGMTTHWDGHDLNINAPWLQSNLSSADSLNSLSSASLDTAWDSNTVNTFTDMFGNTYDGGIAIDADGYGPNSAYDVTYNLNGEYKQLTGTLVPDSSYRGNTNYPDLGDLTIIADGKTIYSSGDITSGMTSPTHVSVDLTNVNKIEIRLEEGQTSGVNGGNGQIGFVGVNLYK